MDNRSEDEWQRILTPEQFRILRKGGCEPPFSGEHNVSRGPGIYRCVGCAQELFSAHCKFDSECGWPSFYAAAAGERVQLRPDHHPDYPGIEVLCSRCGGHLGHIFDDGPEPTGKRYCINSVCLEFIPDL